MPRIPRFCLPGVPAHVNHRGSRCQPGMMSPIPELCLFTVMLLNTAT